MKYNFSRKTQLEKHLGNKFKYESVEFGVEGAETMEQAITEVEQELIKYVKSKKKLLCQK